MTDYTKTTDFGVKDGLSTGNANKLVRGSEFDTEFDAIQTAVATKADKASPTFTGTVTGADLTINGTFKLADTSDDHYYTWAVNELTADRTVTMPLLTGNDTFVFQAHTATLTNKTIDLTSNTLVGSKTEFNTALESDTFLMGSDLLDEDTMTSNSATKPASQQSIKAYVDAQVGGTGALVASNNLSDLTNAATARSNLGLVIGTNVQAYDAQLADVAGLTPTDGNFIVGNGTNFVAESGATARTSLGLGSLATASTVNNDNWSGTDLAVTNGGTGASTAVAAAHALIDGISLTAATVAGTDKVLIQDTDGSDVLKTVTAQSIADLGSGGAVVFLGAASASNDATIDFTSTQMDGTYDGYMVHLQDVTPATDGATLAIRTSTDGGSTFDGGASDYNKGGSASSILVGGAMGSDANEHGMSGFVYVYNATAAQYKRIHWVVSVKTTAGTPAVFHETAERNAAADVNGIRFFFNSGNVESGLFAIYGIKRS